MFGKPRTSIPVAGKTGIPVKRTAQASTTGRSTPASGNSSIPVASKVSGKRFGDSALIYGNVSRVRCLKVSRSSIVTRNPANEPLTTDER